VQIWDVAQSVFIRPKVSEKKLYKKGKTDVHVHSFYVNEINRRGYAVAQLVSLQFFVDFIPPTALMQ
jgi:hypothetical protein